MGDRPPRIETRRQRALTYLAHNRDRIVIDVCVTASWLLLTWGIFGFFGLPRWLMYVVLILGVIFYSRITPTWERPYRSPDLVD